MMEKQIKKLVSLAHKYVEFGKASQLPQTHNTLREEDSDLKIPSIKIYFANDYETQSVYFGAVDVVLYANKIDIPLDSTEKSLEVVYKDALKYYKQDLSGQIDHLLEQSKREKIENLKKIEKRGRMVRKQLKEEGLI